MARGAVEYKLIVVYAAFVIFLAFISAQFVGYMAYVNPNVREILSISPTLKKAIETGEIGPVRLPCQYNKPMIDCPKKVTWSSWKLAMECPVGIKLVEYNYTLFYTGVTSMDTAECKKVPYRIEFEHCTEGFDCVFVIPQFLGVKKLKYVDFTLDGGGFYSVDTRIGVNPCNFTKGTYRFIIKVYNREFPEYYSRCEIEAEIV